MDFGGPKYPYQNYIKTPNQMGVGPGANDIVNDIRGIMSYVQILIQGGGAASGTGRPLGNKFFAKTAMKCKAKDTGDSVDRYIYVNNVPTGSIPFISGGTGANFSEFRGLIPGVLSDLEVLDPRSLMGAFTTSSDSSCVSITMETIDSSNNASRETHYVTAADVDLMDPCLFPDGKNPLNGKGCRMAFTNMNPAPYSNSNRLPNDPIVQLYFFALGILAIYCMYLLAYRKR